MRDRFLAGIGFLLVLLFCGCGSPLGGKRLVLLHEGRQVTVRTERLQATISDGRIIQCQELSSGKIFAAPGNDAGSFPYGLGCLKDQVEELRKLHVPWGSVELNQHLTDKKFTLYLYPDDDSPLRVKEFGRKWQLTWTNLTNGQERFPNCRLTLILDIDANGALTWQAEGEAPQGGIFGIQTPLSNIPTAVRFIFPHFGGMEFQHRKGDALCPFGGAPFWEAPAVALEHEGMALGMWMENPTFSPYYAFFKNGDGGFSFSYELNSLMPVENKKLFSAPAVKLDIFPGDWKTALTPFRNWYQKTFADEIALRDSITWADQIKLIIDMGANYEKVAATFPPETVMYHNWNARAPKFDTELPDWTPREGYIDSVRKIHSFGFKSMAYVNTYCINYQSPVFQRDGLENIFLTRKNSLWRYNSQAPNQQASLSDMLIGTVNQMTGPDQFAGIAPGRLLYGDPLSAAWRQYHADSMKVWNTTTGTDANYEDTAGCVNDHGNGIVDGLSAGQGSVAQMRLLQQTQPGVPMASEYGPEGIAFAVKWPLNYAQVWGSIPFRQQRLHRQLPVTTYLYGYTTWIPIINCGNDFTRHLISACSDALGGMGMLHGNFAEADSGGMSAHLTHRALLFTKKRLKPHFPADPYPANIRCFYQGVDGIYQYYDDGCLQKMLGPDGSELYGRLDGARQYQGTLRLPGWPLYNEKGVFGLNPAISYALFPGTGSNPSQLQIRELPEHVSLARYYTGPGFAFLELKSEEASGQEIAFRLHSQSSFRQLYINDKKNEFASGGEYRGKLPLRILVCDAPAPVEYGRPVGTPSTLVWNIGQMGIHEGQPVELQALPNRRTFAKQPAYFVNYYQERQMDWTVQVPDREAALQILFKNFSNRYGNGSILKIRLNGKLIHAFDCQKPNPDYDPQKKNAKTLFNTALQERILPLGEFAGETVLVSISVDDKSDTNSDNQSVTIPVLIRDPEQKWKEQEL